jgi:membrane protein required for beta-lactamase induction
MGFLMMLFWLILLIAIAYLVYRLVAEARSTKPRRL